MGQIVKGKKKGRPSKSDLSKCSYKAAKTEQPENQPRRSLRPRGVRYTFDLDDYLDDDELFEEFEDEEDERRREKKLNYLLKLHQSNGNSRENSTTRGKVTESTPSRARRVSHASSASQSSEEECRGEVNKRSKKRKTCGGDDDDEDEDDDIDGIDDEDNDNVESVEGFHNVGKADNKRMDFEPGTPLDLVSRVPIPEKKVLELVLDKLQKKDIYGVYAEPVDPDELPDYHDIIEHPMDFATVRSKLANGSYATLERFESDVFLICSNAMQYNEPDTVYYKQARAIQELAKKKFEKIRLGIERSEEPLKSDQKPKMSSIMKRPIRKLSSRELQDPLGSDFSSGATLATAEDFHNSPNAAHASGSARASSVDRIVEGYMIIDNSVEKADESVPGKRLPSRIERKPSINDEMRRTTFNTYIPPSSCSETIFSAFEGESKHLIPVGLYVDHSYARSLARFASTLGPVAWGIASSRIEQALPSGCKFGRGWVGDYEPLPTPLILLETCTIKEPALFKAVDDDDTKKRTISSNQDFVEEKPVTTLHLEKSGKRVLASKDSQIIESNLLLEKKSSFPSPATIMPMAVSHPGFPVLSETQHLRFPPGFDERSLGNGMKPTFPAAASFQQTNLQPRNSRESEKKAVKQVLLNGQTLSTQSPAAASSTMQRQNLNNSELPALMPMVMPPTNNNHLPPGFFKQPGNNTETGVVAGLRDEKVKNINNNRTDMYGSKPVGYFPHGQDQQGLTDPVQLMRTLSEKAPNQQRLSVQSVDNKPIMPPSPSSRRDDSPNASARGWMSVGSGGFKSSGENIASHNKSHISSESLYNNTSRDFQPQASRFRGDHPSYVMKTPYSSPPFVSQPGRIISDVQFQNQPVVGVVPPHLLTADLSRFQSAQWTASGFPRMQQPRQKMDSLPPDLNISFPSSGSPGRPASNVLVDSQQPDLALQL